MQLNIATLLKSGAFTGRPVRRDIAWTQGQDSFTATVFIRPLGYQTAVSDVLASAGKQDSIAGRIAAAICDEDGNPVFTPLDITHGPIDPIELEKDPATTKRMGALDGNLTVALLAVIHEVNSMGKTKSSLSTKSSGTSSSSPALAGGRSRKPKSA